MSDDNTKDGATPSLASGGSHGDDGIISWEQADQIMQEQRAEIARMRLTDAEREAIALAKSRLGTSDGDWQADDVLAALLERLK